MAKKNKQKKGKRSAARKPVQLNVEQAKQQLKATAESLVKRYAVDGLIDRRTRDFANEYLREVNGIVRPFVLAKNVDAVAELSIARLWQARRIDVADEGEFYDRELAVVDEQLEWVYGHGDDEQRGRLFASLAQYLTDELGDRRGWVSDRERSLIQSFISDVYSLEPRFATEVIEFADAYLEETLKGTVDTTGVAVEGDPDAGGQWYGGPRETENKVSLWTMTRLTAMSTRRDPADEMHAYAEENGLLDFAEAVFMVADAYVPSDKRKAVAVLREHMGAVDMYYPLDKEHTTLELVDYMLVIAYLCYSDDELIDLYYDLVLDESSTLMFSWHGRNDREDIIRWYDELHGMVGDPEWNAMREKLLSQTSDRRRRILLAHESYVRGFHRSMAEALGDGSSIREEYGEDSSGTGPLFPATDYIRYAETLMSRAKSREDYYVVARALEFVSTLCGEQVLAKEAASRIALAHPRKKVLHDELLRAGFDV